jgi:response regulator RpfG family c-di-GMP phosphodiesterase
VTEKILCVDDEPQVLQAIKRQLRKRFDITTAEGGEEALRILKEKGPFAVIVVDMRMPGMDGVQLLSRIKDSHPDMVRLMLTGNADQETAVEAVNKGQVFRFLNKPCPTSILAPALALALRQYRLLTAEKELLNKTLKGSIDVMAELLSLANAAAFSSGYRIKPLVKQLVNKLELPKSWQYEISAMMSQIGCITLPSDILHKKSAGVELSPEEEDMFRQHPETGARLVRQIPRLEKVADIIALQLQHFDQFDDPNLDEEVTLGAQVLKVAIDYDTLLLQDIDHREALRILQERTGIYNPDVLSLLAGIRRVTEKTEIRNVRFQDIMPGMVAEEDVTAKTALSLSPKDRRLPGRSSRA